jgi:hypothetical protein
MAHLQRRNIVPAGIFYRGLTRTMTLASLVGSFDSKSARPLRWCPSTPRTLNRTTTVGVGGNERTGGRVPCDVAAGGQKESAGENSAAMGAGHPPFFRWRVY